MGLPVFEATNRYFLGNGWRVLAVDRNPEKLKELPVMTETQVPRHAKLAIIGVRPQDFPALREETINAEVIVSMMAGIPCDALQAAFPDAQIIRIIPNTPCAFGVGLTPVYVQPRATPPVRLSEILTGIGCLGPLLFVAEEDMIDKATGVSAGLVEAAETGRIPGHLACFGVSRFESAPTNGRTHLSDGDILAGPDWRI